MWMAKVYILAEKKKRHWFWNQTRLDLKLKLTPLQLCSFEPLICIFPGLSFLMHTLGIATMLGCFSRTLHEAGHVRHMLQCWSYLRGSRNHDWLTSVCCVVLQYQFWSQKFFFSVLWFIPIFTYWLCWKLLWCCRIHRNQREGSESPLEAWIALSSGRLLQELIRRVQGPPAPCAEDNSCEGGRQSDFLWLPDSHDWTIAINCLVLRQVFCIDHSLSLLMHVHSLPYWWGNRFGDRKQFAQSSTAGKWGKQYLNSDLSDSKQNAFQIRV